MIHAYHNQTAMVHTNSIYARNGPYYHLIKINMYCTMRNCIDNILHSCEADCI